MASCCDDGGNMGGWYAALFSYSFSLCDGDVNGIGAVKSACSCSRTGHGTVEHTLHGKRRAALRPLFSQRAIAGANVIMQEQVQILADTLHRKYIAGEVVELRSVFVAFATDTIYQYAMGDSMGLQNDERRARRWWWTLEAVSKMTPMAKQFPWMLPLGQKMPLGLIQRLKPEMAGLLGIHKVRLRHYDILSLTSITMTGMTCRKCMRELGGTSSTKKKATARRKACLLCSEPSATA